MDTKLTLSMNHEVIAKAKQYARSTGRSLSDLVENYLRLVVQDQTTANHELPTGVKSLLGSFSIPENKDIQIER